MISCLQLGTFGTDLDFTVMSRLFQRPIAMLKVYYDRDAGNKAITYQKIFLPEGEGSESAGSWQQVCASKSPLM